MMVNPKARRRANAFADALEDGSRQAAPGKQHGQPGQQAAHAADRHAGKDQGRLLSLANVLRDVPRPTLDENRKVEQRAQLIAAMETALTDGTLRVPEQRDTEKTAGSGPGSAIGGRRVTRGGLRRFKPRSRWSRRLAAGGLSVGVAAGAFGGVAAASTNALPGDTLYGLKRGMEDMRLTMAGDESRRGEMYLDLASTRLQEARRLMERQKSGRLDQESVGDVRKALSGMRQEASEGHRLLSTAYERDGSLGPMEALNAFSAAHRKGWSELRGRLPAQLSDVSQQVNSVFDAMEQDVAPLKSVLPPADGSGSSQGRHGRSPGGGTRRGTGQATPSAGLPSGSAPSQGIVSSTSPSSKGADTGLIGDAGDLLGNGSGPVFPSAGASASTETVQPSVTLPPLLPGVLPGLGIGAGDVE